MSSITVAGVRRSYPGRPPVPALRGVDLDVEPQTLVAVLGPSGCGKTTLLRTLAGMERADAGTLHVGDRLVDGNGTFVPPERRRIGLVPQEGALFPHLDVARNIAFGLQGLDRSNRRLRVDEMLELVGLAGLGKRRPDELSGGQQQRVALARALAPGPEVVLLDEPFSALDTGLRAALRDEVATTLRKAGTTAVLVTHDQTEAMTMADSLAVMRDGVIVQFGPPSDVYRRPIDPWTAGFLGESVMVPGRRRDSDPNTVECPLGVLRLAADCDHHAGPDVTVFCRPEQLRPAADGAAATVTEVRFQGPDALVWLRVHGADAPVIARWPSAIDAAPGDTVNLEVVGAVLAFAPTA